MQHQPLPQLCVSTLPHVSPSLDWAHANVDRQYSAPSNCLSQVANSQPSFPSAPIIGCNNSATNMAHYCGYAPVSSLYLPYHYFGAPCSTSLFLIHLLEYFEQTKLDFYNF